MEGNRLSTEKHRINKAITAQQVRLIDQNGEAVGVVNIRAALAQAEKAGLDLVEVSPNAAPPVCKIIDYGKLKYELQKKKAEAKKKQKIIEIKEVKFTPVIGEHDYQVKLNSILKFVKEGNKVKVTLKFRGRELSRQEIGVKLLNRLIDDVKVFAKNESNPQLEGRQMMMIISPVSQK